LSSSFLFQAEDGIRDRNVTGVQTCALPICRNLALKASLARWLAQMHREDNWKSSVVRWRRHRQQQLRHVSTGGFLHCFGRTPRPVVSVPPQAPTAARPVSSSWPQTGAISERVCGDDPPTANRIDQRRNGSSRGTD